MQNNTSSEEKRFLLCNLSKKYIYIFLQKQKHRPTDRRMEIRNLTPTFLIHRKCDLLAGIQSGLVWKYVHTVIFCTLGNSEKMLILNKSTKTLKILFKTNRSLQSVHTAMYT